MRTVVLDHGHGPGAQPRVIGARIDRRGNEARLVEDVREFERDLVLRYGHILAVLLAARGVTVRGEFEGSYRSRQERADGDCYVVLHANASSKPTSDYALTLCELRDTEGLELARAIRQELGELPEIGRTVSGVWEDTGKDPGHKIGPHVVYGPGGRYCVKHTPDEVPTVLVEPFFLTCPKHADLRTQKGLERIATAIADGILEWLA